jgi:hypothetical protein
MENRVYHDWWLDEASLPTLIWARLFDGMDGWQVLCQDGSICLFESRSQAQSWLSHEEYVPYNELLAQGEVDASARPPNRQNNTGQST